MTNTNNIFAKACHIFPIKVNKVGIAETTQNQRETPRFILLMINPEIHNTMEMTSGLLGNGIPEAMGQNRGNIKRCLEKYIEKGRRLLKLNQLMDEMEIVINDLVQRKQVMEGDLGKILCFTQVLPYFFFNFTVFN